MSGDDKLLQSPLALSFRSATAGDVESVVRILNEAADFLDAVGPEPLWARDTIDRAAVSAVVDEFVVARDDAGGADVGVFRFQRSDDLFWSDVADPPGTVSAFVHKVAVVRSVAGRGVSDALLRHAKALAAAAGCTLLRLDCAFEQRDKLVAFYVRNGFVPHSIKAIPFYPWRVQRFELKL